MKTEPQTFVSDLPSHLVRTRDHVEIGPLRPFNTEGRFAHDAYQAIGFDNSFRLKSFQENFKLEIVEKTEDSMVIEMMNIDVPLVNAFRRILLNEVPTMAIELVSVIDNTSIIHDEILAHRFGLVPIAADPDLFEEWHQGEEITESNSIKFRLQVECTVRPGSHPDAPPSERFINSAVTSGMLEWEPIGKQAKLFADCPFRPVHDDILLAKLRPGQRIDVVLTCVKGIGRTHAKWSPVATAFYQMLPKVEIIDDITGAQSSELVSVCPVNVFDLEDFGQSDSRDQKAIVARPRDCTMCRECVREKPWEDKIRLSKIRNHFLFSIESTGAVRVDKLFTVALEILISKCLNMKDSLGQAVRPGATSTTGRPSERTAATPAMSSFMDDVADDD